MNHSSKQSSLQFRCFGSTRERLINGSYCRQKVIFQPARMGDAFRSTVNLSMQGWTRLSNTFLDRLNRTRWTEIVIASLIYERNILPRPSPNGISFSGGNCFATFSDRSKFEFLRSESRILKKP